MTWEERGDEHLSINLRLSEEMTERLEKRHLQPEEVQFAIYHAEQENDKLCDADDPAHCLVKCLVGLGLYHIEYTLVEESGQKVYDVATAYACSTQIK